MKRSMPLGVVLVLVIICAALAASASSRGQLRRNLELEQSMLEGRPPAGYRYYATGRGGVPDAVLGLSPEYTQTARLWREIPADSEELTALIRNVMIYHEFRPRAAEVLTPEGKVIGVYWSTLYWTSVVMGQDNEVKVYKPRIPEETVVF